MRTTYLSGHHLLPLFIIDGYAQRAPCLYGGLRAEIERGA
jgi:hypothetical protein